MTTYAALRAASATLKALLEAHVTDSGEAGLDGVPVDLRSPRDLEQDHVTEAVSLWLFRVGVQPDLVNRPVARVGDDELPRVPLPLELAYLVTPVHGHAATQLALAGRIAQVLWDHRRLRGGDLRDVLAGSGSELRLHLEATSIGESANLWYSLQSPYRLAVPLRVEGVVITSHRPTALGPPVLERTAGVAAIVGSA